MWHSRNLAWDLFIVGAGLLRNQYTHNTDHQKSAKKSYGLCGTGWPGVCWPCCFSTWATLSTQSGHPSWVSWATLVGPVGSLQSFWSPSSSTPLSSEGLVTRQFKMQARDSSPRSGLLFHVHCPKLNMAINVFVSWWKKKTKYFNISDISFLWQVPLARVSLLYGWLGPQAAGHLRKKTFKEWGKWSDRARVRRVSEGGVHSVEKEQ